jgi:predicted phosphate transport protein (TIGR00153 family)
MLEKLLPREDRFFDLFNRHAEEIVAGAKALADLMTGYREIESRPQHIAEIERAEKAADRVTHETLKLLHGTFITPLDRDDIHKLITTMDDILDLIQDVAESATLYDLQRITPEAQQLAEIAGMCCQRVRSAVQMLSGIEQQAEAILRTCQEIDQLESDADRVMRSGMSRLFRDESDVRQLIKLKAIYELLEEVTDRCEDLANLIEGVVLENA